MKKSIICSALGLALLGVIIYHMSPASILSQYLISAERTISGLSVKRLDINGLKVEYLRGGRGEPLLLLHGFGANKDNWNRLAAYLVNDFDVIAIDLPGFGNSISDISLDYDVLSQVERLNEITHALNINQFYLAGSSMGGYIAGNFAAKFPNKINGLWLISPFGVVKSERSEMFFDIKNGKNPMVLPRSELEFNALFEFVFVDPPFIPSPVVRHLANEAEHRVPLNKKIFAQIHRMESAEPNPDLPLDRVLDDYQGRVLVTWGAEDRVLHVSGAKTLEAIVENITVEILNDTGHLPMIERAKKTAESFQEFADQSRLTE